MFFIIILIEPFCFPKYCQVQLADPRTIRVGTAQVQLCVDFFQRIQYKTVNVFTLPYDFLNNIFSSLAYFHLRIQHIILTYKIRLHQLSVLSVELLVNNRLSVKFLGSQSRFLTNNPHVVQRPTISLGWWNTEEICVITLKGRK